jgi:calcium-dependent protein kinase
MAYCHERKIIHRDLKPENIMIDDPKLKNFDIKVIDFGASLIHNAREGLLDKFGTVYYIAPEVIKGNYNEKCDVWV